MTHFQKRLIVELSIALIILLALAGGLFFFGSKIKNSGVKISSLRQELADRSASLNFLAFLRTQYIDKGDAYLNVMHNLISTKDQLIDLPKEFETLARQQSLGFGFSFAGETPAVPPALGSVTFKLNVQSPSLNELFRFVERLQNFKYLMTADSFNLKRQDSSIQMGITGRVFFR